MQLQDILNKDDEISKSFESIKNDFGGLGSLTLIFKSNDSLANYNLAKDLASKLSEDESIHFIEYETDISFYEKYKFLFINNSDLDTIINRVEQLRKFYVLKENPFFVDLSQDSTQKSDTSAFYQTNKDFINFNLEDLEQKYFKKLKLSHSNANGTIRIVDIYPSHSITDLYACRKLVSKVQNIIKENKNSNQIKVYYTGKAYDVIQTGRAILPVAKGAGKIMALLILILLIIHFHSQPQLIFVSAIPIGIPLLFTLSIAQILYGRINIFSLILALLLPGLACQIITHILTRYFMERAHKLSPNLSIESALLGIGPSTVASTLIMSSIFAGLTFIPVAGIRELGVLGVIGCLLNWFICTLLVTSLLTVLQKKKPFKVNKFIIKRKYRFTMMSFKTNTIILVVITLASLLAIFFGSTRLKVLYDFKKTEIQHNLSTADSLIAQTEFPQYDPIIVQMPSAEAGDSLINNFQNLKQKGVITTIDKIFTLSQLSPSLQPEKKKKLEKLNSLISDKFIENIEESEKNTIKRLAESLNFFSIDEDEYTLSQRQKFGNKNGDLGVFAFIFPNINQDNGLECRRLDKDLKKFDGIIDGSFKIYGTPLLRAGLLDRIFPHLYKPIVFGSMMVCFLLLLFYNKLSRATFTLLPSIFAISWVLMILQILDIEISIYSAISFVFLIGASVDGSLILWSSFYDKQVGTALIILQRKFTGIVISQMACLVGTYGLLISTHPGLKSIGILSLIGLLCIFAAQFTIFPLIAGALDNYRLRKKKLKNDKKTVY